MKKCEVCKADSAHEAETCHACGEASWMTGAANATASEPADAPEGDAAPSRARASMRPRAGKKAESP